MSTITANIMLPKEFVNATVCEKYNKNIFGMINYIKDPKKNAEAPILSFNGGGIFSVI